MVSQVQTYIEPGDEDISDWTHKKLIKHFDKLQLKNREMLGQLSPEGERAFQFYKEAIEGSLDIELISRPVPNKQTISDTFSILLSKRERTDQIRAQFEDDPEANVPREILDPNEDGLK